jgi:hypothetical protein
VALALILAVGATLVPASAAAQLRNARPALTFSGAVTLSVEARSQISAYYSSHSSAPQALPPGIRKNLQRGKPIPPGLARKSVPGALRSDLAVPSGYDVVEVGLDVLLVEVATGVIHDILMDVVR